MATIEKVSEGFLVSAKLIDNTNNKTYDISDAITKIAVKENYLENSFPLFVIGTETTADYRKILIENNV